MDMKMKLSMLEAYDYENDCNYIPQESHENFAEYTQVSAELAKVEEEIDLANADVRCIKEEMRYKVRRMFPNPVGLTPKHVIRRILTSRVSVF